MCIHAGEYVADTGWYYLNSRYYDLEVKRFINADTTDILSATGNLYDKNLFAYCDNNPVMRVDVGGEFWDTVFDVVSLVTSVAEVIVNPTDPMAWAGLAADVVCPVTPGLTGGGTLVRAASKADDVVDAVRAVDRVDDVVDTVNTTKKATTIHANSLSSSRVNYGYVLVDSENNIMKFGEAVNLTRRYTQKYLNQHGYTMRILESGSKADIHYWQYDMNNYYFQKYNQYTPLIRSRRGW